MVTGRIGCLLVLTAAVLRSAHNGQQPPLIRVPVKLVVAPTLVLSSKGTPISGLDSSNFRLFDNDRLQGIKIDVEPGPLAAAVVVQTSQSARDYVPLIAKTGSVFDSLLLGANGHAAVISYSNEVNVVSPFGGGDVESALKRLPVSGEKSRSLDAGMLAVQLLKTQPISRTRLLLFVGQSFDSGSEATLDDLRALAQAENILIYSLSLPLAGKKFVADTFSFPSMARQGGGVAAGVELTSLIPALRRGEKSRSGKDPFSQLTAATGGTQIHCRKQLDFENGITVMGDELRSTYLLTYAPEPLQAGYHSIRVEVNVPGAHTYTRPGYVLDTN